MATNKTVFSGGSSATIKLYVATYIYIAKVRTQQQQQKQAWYIQEVKEIRGVTENSANTEVKKIPRRRKGESHRDAFRPCSRVSSGGRTSRETNWKSWTGEKDRFNQQPGT